jgi:hypothetical protein
MNLFETPIKKVKVRNNIFAYKYQNGCVNIEGNKYFGYSINDAIKKFRNSNPIK